MQRPATTRSWYGRLGGFVRKSYPLGVQIPFATILFLALSGGFAAVAGEPALWRFDGAMALGIVVVFGIFFFLRVVDEVKDCDYDRVQNPDRPLVTGLVRHRDLFWFGVGTIVAVGVVHSALPPVLLVLAVADMLYGAFLIKLERWSPAVAQGPFVGLVAVYPVNIGVSCYVLLFMGEVHGLTVGWPHAWLVAAFTLAFLHYEFARKTVRKAFAKPGEKLYADRIGLFASNTLCLAFAVAACGIAVALFRRMEPQGAAAYTQYLLALPLLVAVGSIARFCFVKRTRVTLRVGGTLFLLLFYAAVIAHAFALKVS